MTTTNTTKKCAKTRCTDAATVHYALTDFVRPEQSFTRLFCARHAAADAKTHLSVPGRRVVMDAVGPDAVKPVDAAQAEPGAVHCTRCRHDAAEHVDGFAECYVCPCARLLPRNDDDVDVEVGPSAELLRLTYNALVVQQVSGALDRAGLSRLEAARRAGIDPVTLARRMTGGTFTIAELGALADACGVRPSVWLRAVDDTLADAECMPLHHAPGTPCGCASLFDPDLDEKTPAARGAYLHPLGHDGTGLRGEAHIVKCDDCLVVLNSGHRYYADRADFPGYGNLHLGQALADHHNRTEH